jgi:hypothetical protein
VLVERAALLRDGGKIVVLGLIGRQRPAFEEGNLFVEDRRIACGSAILVGDERQPQVVVGELRANAATAWRVPPVLHVALNELARCRAQDVLTGDRGRGVNERHDILQLVAEAIGPARLVEGRARRCGRPIKPP